MGGEDRETPSVSHRGLSFSEAARFREDVMGSVPGLTLPQCLAILPSDQRP